MTEQDYAAKVRAAVEALPSHVDSSLVSRAAVLAILAAPAPSEPGLDDHRYCLADECWHTDAPAPSEPGLDVPTLWNAIAGRHASDETVMDVLNDLRGVSAEYARLRGGQE